MTCFAPALTANLCANSCQKYAEGMFDALNHVHAENTGTATNVQDNLILENVTILVDRITVRSGTDIIFLEKRSALVINVVCEMCAILTYKHFLMNA